MARRLDQIEKDLVAIEEAMGSLAGELEQSYEQYLAELATVASQQLVLAAYHLCTQGYPEQFLALSASHREELQQALRAIARDATEHLQGVLHPKPSDPDPVLPPEAAEPLTAAVVLDDQGKMHEETAIAASQSAATEDAAPPDATAATTSPPDPDSTPAAATETTDSATEAAAPADPTDPADPADDIAAYLAARAQSVADTEGTVVIQLGDQFGQDGDAATDAPSILPADPLDRLVTWNERLESGIADALQTLSYGANRLLHRAGVLPRQLPEPVLEVAIKSGMTAESAGSPNLMKLMIEAKSEDSDEGGVLQFVIIRLRQAELEFGNPSLSSRRSQIRQLLSRLGKIGKDYRRRQREKATVQAELAWRATWHEG